MPTKKKMPIWDVRMLALMDFVIKNEIKKCTTQLDFCNLIGLDKTAITQVRDLRSSFQHKHILTAWEVFGVSPNYFYGLTTAMFQKPVEPNPIMMIKEAVRILEKK